MSLIQNERTKLLAAALDRASTACFALGVVGPIIAFLYKSDEPSLALPDWRYVVGPLIWFAAAVLLHLAGRAALGRLK